MNRHSLVLGTVSLLLAVLLSGCDVNISIGSGAATATPLAPAPSATALPETALPPPAPPTPTPPPPTPTPLPPTPLPTAPEATPTPQRIRFAPGATSAAVAGHVAANDMVLYVLRALEGQTMTVDLLSPASDVVLEIWGEDGSPLLRHITGQTHWTGQLYATQDYFIKVVSFGSAVDYTLTVTIPPPESEPAPQRIQFAVGATSAAVAGHVAANDMVLYVLRALEGQTMTVDLLSPASDVVLEIWGEDGSPLLRHITGQTHWTGQLYATQDYFIKVVSFGSAVDYTLTVTIP